LALNPFETAAILIVLATILGYINYRFVGLPHTIGLTVIGALASLAVVLADMVLPVPLDEAERSLLASIDFSDPLLNGLLSVLLFAGALHVNLTSLLERKWTVLLLASIRQNDVMKKLAGWAAILAVPTAVFGLYGMNFQDMPEVQSPYGYPAVLGVVALLCGYLYYRFRRAGWF
jgi:hypothetical protein